MTPNKETTQDDRPDALTQKYLGFGPHEVRVIDEFEVHDPARQKDIPVKAYYPIADGPFPVIIFSHGAGDSNESSPHLMRHWASHGYVVLLPTHYFGERPRIERSLGRLARELLRPARQGPSAWFERTCDIRAVLDHLPSLGSIVPALDGKADPSRIGIGGHSFGAYTTMLLGGATLVDKDGSILHFGDPRPKAFMMISGPGHDSWGLTESSYDAMARPLMVFAGSHDPPPTLASDPMWRAEAYTRGPAGDKYLAFIRGANHMSYVGPIFDLPLWDPGKRGSFARAIRRFMKWLAAFAPGLDQVGIFDYSRIASTAFWDAHLKEDSCSAAYLRCPALARYSRGVVRLQHK